MSISASLPADVQVATCSDRAGRRNTAPGSEGAKVGSHGRKPLGNGNR